MTEITGLIFNQHKSEEKKIVLTTITPFIVAIIASFYFKETRWLGIVALCFLSFMYPKSFIVFGVLAATTYYCWKLRKG